MMNSSQVLILVVVPGIFALVGAAMIFSGIRAKRAAERAATWPSIAGTVTSAEIVTHRHHNSKSHTTTYTYEPKVEYSYTVLGTPYTGKRLAYGPNSYAKNKADELLARYPQGQSVSVFYNTEDPAESVLNPAAPNTTVLTVVGIISCVLALVLAVIFLVTSL
jgi:hypothetical protein